MNSPQQPMQVPPVDPGNPILQPGPALLTAAPANGAPYVIVTMRTSSGTLTAFVPRDDVANWESTLRAARQQTTGLIVANGASLPVIDPRAN